MSVSVELRKSLESLSLFTELVRSQIDRPQVEFERLLDGYLDERRSLAKQFAVAAHRFLLRDETLLDGARNQIEERMRSLFSGRIPDRYLVIHGYKSVHPILLQYLAQHVGNPVRASKLRVLTGDQIHTERRVRDLRDLGFQVEWHKVADEDQYILKSLEPDVDGSAALLVRRNIKNDKKLARREKEGLMGIV